MLRKFLISMTGAAFLLSMPVLGGQGPQAPLDDNQGGMPPQMSDVRGVQPMVGGYGYGVGAYECGLNGGCGGAKKVKIKIKRRHVHAPRVRVRTCGYVDPCGANLGYGYGGRYR